MNTATSSQSSKNEGVFCYQKMPFRLKNARATYQILVDKVFHDQIGRNLEAYVDDMVIKSTSEGEMLADINETFEKFRSINMKLNPKKCSFGVEEGPFLGHLITKQGIKAKPSKVKAITDVEQPKTLKDVQSLNEKIAALSRFLSKGAERSLPFFKVLKSCTDKKNIQWTQEAEAALQEMKKFMEILPTLTAPIQGEILMMYLTASTKSIRGYEVAKWAIELGEHNIVFQERGDKTPKDFLIEVPLEDNERKAEEKADMKLMKTKLSCEWKLFTDGDASSNGSGAGPILIDPEGKEYTYALRFGFKITNNEEEYKALLAGLQISQEMEITSLAIFVDSQLLVNQIKASPQTDDIIKEVHEGSCGFNTEPRSMVVRITKQGYYWLSMHRDAAKEYVVCRFGVPRTISSKDEKHFQEGIFADLCKGLKVTQSFFPIMEHMEIILTYGSEAIIRIPENDVAKDDRGRIKEVDKRRENKEITSIEEAYYRSKLCRHHSERSSHSIYKIGDFVLLSQSNSGGTQASTRGAIRLKARTEDEVAL
ncbi:reverse transcriptase domain-containing protein [Tanacetum coccineum]